MNTEYKIEDVFAKCDKCGKYITENQIYYGNYENGFICEECAKHLTDEEIDKINKDNNYELL